MDTTIKPVFGHQQGAEVGYNPHKPGRPSHAYHTLMVRNLRLVLDVEVRPGNSTPPSMAQRACGGSGRSLQPSADRPWCAGMPASVTRS